MSGYQFIHLSSFSDTKPKARLQNGKLAGGHAKWNAREILDEATRTPGAFHHVSNPKTPIWFQGSRLLVEHAGSEWKNKTIRQSKTGPRKIRSDSPWLAAGVVSYPAEDIAAWPVFRDSAILWLVDRYGDRFRGAVEHLDESHPHLHFFIVPRPGESFGKAHCGFGAKEIARKACDRAVGKAYCDAMKSFQDDFYSQVGSGGGLARFGPKRRRATRLEWKLQQIEEEIAGKRRAADEEAAAVLSAAKARIGIADAQLKEAKEKHDALRRSDVERLQAVGDVLLKTPRFLELEAMREQLKKAQSQIDAGNFAAAQKLHDAAKAIDPAPDLQRERIRQKPQ